MMGQNLQNLPGKINRRHSPRWRVVLAAYETYVLQHKTSGGKLD